MAKMSKYLALLFLTLIYLMITVSAQRRHTQRDYGVVTPETRRKNITRINSTTQPSVSTNLSRFPTEEKEISRDRFPNPSISTKPPSTSRTSPKYETDVGSGRRGSPPPGAIVFPDSQYTPSDSSKERPNKNESKKKNNNKNNKNKNKDKNKPKGRHDVRFWPSEAFEYISR